MDLLAFEYKISLGQNFIFDPKLLDGLVALAGIQPGDHVLEIGAGRGDLTLALARAGARIITYEIDSRLEPVLQDRLREIPHITLLMEDAMQADLASVMGEEAFHVVANLPYYLTSPLLTKLLRLNAPVISINVMVQKEAAQRVVARPGTAEYGPLAVWAQYKTEPRCARQVPAGAFTPPPKVDSVFLTMPFRKKPPAAVADEAVFAQVVQAAFALRRKTLVNNLMNGFHLSREAAQLLVETAGLPEKVRGESLNLEQFAALSNLITHKNEQQRTQNLINL